MFRDLTRFTRPGLIAVAAAFCCALLTEPAMAQCAMCKASLIGANNASYIKHLNIGIAVLLVPPVSIFCSIFIVAIRRHRNR